MVIRTCLLFALLLAHMALAAPLTIFYETREPFTRLTAGSLAGLVGDPVAVALKRADVPFVLSEMPFLRYMTLIQRDLVYGCAAGAVKTAERELAGKFSQPVVRDKPYVLVVRKGNARVRAMTSLKALLNESKLRLLVHEGYSYGDQFNALLATAHSPLLKLPYENIRMVKMVSKDMVDAFIMNGGEAQTILNSLEAGHDLILQALDDAPAGQLRYLFCSKQVGDDIIARLNSHLPKL